MQTNSQLKVWVPDISAPGDRELQSCTYSFIHPALHQQTHWVPPIYQAADTVDKRPGGGASVLESHEQLMTFTQAVSEGGWDW